MTEESSELERTNSNSRVESTASISGSRSESNSSHIAQFFTGKEKKLDPHTLRLLVIEFLVTNNLSFRTTRSPSFQKLMSYLNPITGPGLANLGSEIDKLYDSRLNHFKHRLVKHYQTRGVFSVYLDTWTSRSQHTFLRVTIHWIDSN